MSMATCTECSQPLSTTAVVCPHCGAPAAVALRPPTAEPADWPDSLEAAVRAALQWPEGELAAEQLAQVESVKLDEADAADLTKLVAGLRSLPALKMLGLARAGIADAGPLRELAGLRYLFLEKTFGIFLKLQKDTGLLEQIHDLFDYFPLTNYTGTV